MQQQYIQEMSPFYPPRTRTQHLTTFTRPLPAAVTYDLSVPDQVTISVPVCSTWTSEPHWHETHTEYLQILQGRASIMLAGETKVYGPDDGVVVVERFTVHEWRRADDEEGELVVREWTEPGDGQKEVFFRMLNSFLTEPRPEKMYRQLGLPLSLREVWVEKWVVSVQLFVIFRELDNWPVLVGTTKRVDWLNWTITHAVLWLVAWAGRFLGLEARYVEYLGESTIERGDQKPRGERKDK
jgi:hypothetical protein